jgi:hypothetical protein
VCRFSTESGKTSQYQVRDAQTLASHQGLYRRGASTREHYERSPAADQSASLTDGAVDQCGRSITRALHDGGPGRAAKKAVAAVGATLRSPANAVSVVQQRVDHERWCRDDGAAQVTSLGIHQVDGHGGANTNDTDRSSLGEVVRTDRSDEAINP